MPSFHPSHYLVLVFLSELIFIWSRLTASSWHRTCFQSSRISSWMWSCNWLSCSACFFLKYCSSWAASRLPNAPPASRIAPPEPPPRPAPLPKPSDEIRRVVETPVIWGRVRLMDTSKAPATTLSKPASAPAAGSLSIFCSARRTCMFVETGWTVKLMFLAAKIVTTLVWSQVFLRALYRLTDPSEHWL